MQVLSKPTQAATDEAQEANHKAAQEGAKDAWQGISHIPKNNDSRQPSKPWSFTIKFHSNLMTFAAGRRPVHSEHCQQTAAGADSDAIDQMLEKVGAGQELVRSWRSAGEVLEKCRVLKMCLERCWRSVGDVLER